MNRNRFKLSTLLLLAISFWGLLALAVWMLYLAFNGQGS